MTAGRSSFAGSCSAAICWWSLAVLLPALAAASGPDAAARQDGFWAIEYDAERERLYFELAPARLGEEFLYLRGLSTGLGAIAPRPLRNLERASVEGETEALVRFERHGSRLLLIQRNLAFRALDPQRPELTRAVDDSFASAVLGSFPIVARPGGRLRVEATDFFLRDAWDIRGRVKEAGEGDIRVDRDRSAFHVPATKAFPRNVEVDVLLTFTGDELGPTLRSHVPDAHSFSLRQHHSFVALPEPGYRARRYDPRISYIHRRFLDFSRPFPEPYERHILVRYRLDKRDPAAALSEPVHPIVFHLDPAIPLPIRRAYREGMLGWNQAFEAAGVRDALRIEDLPEHVDPLDARYNVVLWTFNSAAGVGTGPNIIDPRTGEMIRSTVRIDSHRPLLYANLYAGVRPALARPTSVEEFVNPLLRWHAAHEIGHALGIPDMNYVGADGRPVSIGTLPAPLISLVGKDSVSVSDAVRAGPGPFDELAIRYAYTPFPTGAEEEAGLRSIVREGLDAGIRSSMDFIDTLPNATAFVNGADRIAELVRVMSVRKVLLSRFDASAVEVGDPLWRLQERLFPIYSHHQPSLDAVIKMIGGLDHSVAMRGDGQAPASIIDSASQRRALDAAMTALAPESLEIPERIVAMIGPRPWGYDPGPAYLERYFASSAGPAFDPLSAARTLARRIVGQLLDRERVARLVLFHARDRDNPALSEVLQVLIDRTSSADPLQNGGSGMSAALSDVVRGVVADELLSLAEDPRAIPEAREVARLKLSSLANRPRQLAAH